MPDTRVFLGWPASDRIKPSPITVPWDDDLAVVWDFGVAPHLCVVGTTGGGKSSLLRMLDLGLVRLPGERHLSIIDGEGAGEFAMLTRARNVAGVLNSNEAAYPGSVKQAAKLIEITL